MRILPLLLFTTALSACGGGGGPITVGGNAITGSAAPQVQVSPHTFVNPTETKTYTAIGGVQSFSYATDPTVIFPTGTTAADFPEAVVADQIRANYTRGFQSTQLYAGDATTARNSGITVTYNPRDAIFDIVVAAAPAIVNQTIRFQDPLHRTAFGGLVTPQNGVPDLTSKGVLYLEASNGEGFLNYDPAFSNVFPVSQGRVENKTFFYQKPGTSTQYVTYAGYVRNSVNGAAGNTAQGYSDGVRTYGLERASFVYGERTANGAVPKVGAGTYTGELIASMIYNPFRDTSADAPSYFQWINGTATTKIDFAGSTFTSEFAGTIQAPLFDLGSSRKLALNTGSTFAASGSGRIDIINAGGFLGFINSASFVDTGGNKIDLRIAGSSVDGAFFGPKAEEIGGGFRIVGGTPDQRIDILGAFTGKQN